MRRIQSKLAALALCLCVLAAAAIAPRAFAAGSGDPWYQPYMDTFEQNGWLEGIASDKLQPSDPINRAQFASIVNRVGGLTEESEKIADYTDVPAGSNYRADLAKALAAGYMGGTGPARMSPDAPLTRQDAAVMLARLMKLTASQADMEALKKFSDSDSISSYARESAAAMSAAGYINGDGRKFNPAGRLTLAEAVTMLYNAQDALGGNPGLEGYHFVLMNIPYAQFYAADVANDVPVDAVSSATLNKTRTGTLVSGSYHVDSEGTDITGITFPVAVPDGTDLSACAKVTDSDSVEITVTNRGNTATTTYSGKEALFQNKSYAYYELAAAPSYYKILAADADGTFTFGKTEGAVQTLAGVTAELTTESSYGDYQVSVSGLPEIRTVYAVVLETAEGGSYGLRHLENVWRTSELAWCTGFTEAVHGCPTSSDHYKAMMGQTIKQITYYTEDGILTFPVDLYVPVKFGHTLEAAGAAAEAGKTALTMSGFPQDYEAVYTVNDPAGNVRDTFSCDGAALTWTEASAGANTLTVSDKEGKYAPYKTAFILTAKTAPAVASDAGLVKAAGASDTDFACYLASITSVQVNGTDYAASGRGAVPVIGKDGKVDFSTAAFTGLAGRTAEIAITAQGYDGSLSLTVTVPDPLPAAPSGSSR